MIVAALLVKTSTALESIYSIFWLWDSFNLVIGKLITGWVEKDL